MPLLMAAIANGGQDIIQNDRVITIANGDNAVADNLSNHC
jgi:hypothetical protein